MALLLILLFLQLSHGLAVSETIKSQGSPSRPPFPEAKITSCRDFIIPISAFPNLAIARRGCCSHHNGVCGCKGGRQECCDGTLSPSCRCFTPIQKENNLKEQR
jgi:hypothetical protein